MVTAPIDVPSTGLGLFDRLAGEAAAAGTSGAERSRLRPMLSYHANFPPVTSAEGPVPPDATAPSWMPPMHEPPRETRPPRAIEAPRMIDALVSPVIRDATEPSSQRAANEARPAQPSHIATGSLRVDPGDALRSVIRTRPSPLRTPPSQVDGDISLQAQDAADPRIWATEALARGRDRSVPDPTLAREPRREDWQASATPRLQPVAEPVRAALRSRDASLVSPLPRPVPLRAEPTIEIHIGRIEVRAQTAASPSAAPTPRAAAPSANALAAHLGARGRGARS